ncbi:hypothetical protein ABZ153_20805 [Streptomyces sp. NPDC006290]|uniref:hypothetical protein n=1 Tax=Streptomyces sp. NPDC006290 TaxID=3156745 RepID=UPI0033A95C11
MKPGSTEQPFLQQLPDDFSYVRALQEASVIADNAYAGTPDRLIPAAPRRL